jgi:hypothetical protein
MHNQLEKYLSQIEKQLASLPAGQRQEELREIRSHLEMMIDDNIARGFEADEAVSKALEQFGAAKKVGHDLSFPPGSERSYLLKHVYKLFGMFAAIVAMDVMFNYFPSISLSFFNNWWSLIVVFLVGWACAFFEKRKTVSSFRICVIFCCITTVSFYGGSSGFTSPQDFTFAALFAGFLIGCWQKNRHLVVAN